MMHTSNDECLDSVHPENRIAETSNNNLDLVEVMTGPSGAGVNATTETQTTLIDNEDPLCELVWSAHSGLSLTKCADSGCLDQSRRPFLLWNVWPEINKPPPIEEDKPIPSPEIPDVISESGEKGAISMSSKDVGSDEEVTSASGKSTKNQVVSPIPVVNSGGAENSDHAISRDCLRLEKGKQKALLLSSERTESSCNRGVKRRVDDEEEEEEAGSQRRKIRIPERSRIFSRTVSPSFANWISTLVKGSRDDVARARKSGTESPDSGFRAVFKSLHNPKKSEESRVLFTAFAKISSALKNVTRQLENAESESSSCCFCGEGGHDLRKCPRLTSAELRGLLGRLDSFEEEGPSCFCLKCFRLGHWAASCPSGDADVARAVRKLRLSRDDVLRMMKSDDDVSLDGFFLRLRLRDSGYYVARITGCDSNESISVDVGGMKSSVASRYISNHDFVEGEIEAWWGGTVRAGGKVPSLDELNAKVEDRTRLGLSSRPHDS